MKKYQLILLSILSGLLLAAAWPLNGFCYLIFIAFIPMLWIEHEITKNPHQHGKFSFFLIAFAGFLVWNVLTTYWIWNSTKAGAIFAFLLMTFLMTLVFNFYHYSRKIIFKGNKAYLALILYWIAFEYFNLDWDFSFPWLILGNVFATHPQLVQWFDITGAFGGTLWVMLVNVLLFEILLHIRNKDKFSFKLNNKFLKTSLSCLLIVTLPLIFSLFTYYHYQEKGKATEVVAVQPNIDPYFEQYTTPPLEILERMLNLAQQKTDSNVEFVLFPESALQEYIWEDRFSFSPSVNRLRYFVSAYPKLAVITGLSSRRLLEKGAAITAAARDYPDEKDRYYEEYNTALLVDQNGVLQLYHKSKLTPGVEKMPFKKIFKPIEKFALDLGGTIGTLGIDAERKVFHCKNNSNVSPVICYESVYGAYVSEFVKNGAELLFIITNDGWWGNTAGHRQHFSYAALRAVECRRDFARSANTGISCFINQRGDVLQRTEYWKPDVIRQTLYANNTITFYVKFGDYIGIIALYGGLILLLLSLVKGFLLKRK
ncbi:MAG: apolipoprotein N-acyltransferase [Bacteroidetes bacterium]|nr:apolipoprotein N-acyltransferase [Bacteroidota bacterium]